MASWKSWKIPGGSSNNDDLTGSHAPVPAGSDNPDNRTIAPLSAARLAAAGQRKGFETTQDTSTAVIGRDGLFLQFVMPSEPGVRWMEATCRVLIHSPNADESALLSTEDPVPSPFDLQQVANQWNTHYLQPTVVSGVQGDRHMFVLNYRFFIGSGMSDRQLDALVARVYDVARQAVQKLPEMLTPPDQE